jgi:hypothetical protein
MEAGSLLNDPDMSIPAPSMSREKPPLMEK